MNFGKQAANVSQSIPFSSTNDKKFQAQLNTRVIKLYDFYEIFSLEADRSVTNITSNLYIYKATGKIKEGYDKLKGQMEEFSGFLGIINVLGVNFLVLVKEVNVLFVLDGNDKIFEIASVEFKEVSENPDASKLTKEVQSFLDRIDKILSGGGYYFSYKYPVTLSQQKMFELQNNNSGQQQQKVGSNLSNQLNSKEQQPANIFHFVDYDFMWNYNLMKPLIQQKVSPDWIAQMIQGHVFNIVAHTKNLLYYTLISRRSMRRGGTRFSHRGINSDGFVANFVETEQILIIPSADCIVSHVQIRGSVPTFWKQKGLSAKIIVDSSKLLCNQACKLHLDYLNKNYNEISCANLMSASSTNEQKLTKEYIEQVRDGANQRSTVSYLEFDFHHEVKGEKFDSIDNFIKANLLKVIQKHQYFIRNVKGDILKKQVGIIRTNCVDCLDRTNFFQLRVAFNTLNHVIFPLLNLNFKSQSDGEKFQKDFQQCWGENGDNISMHYADTNATTSNVAKTGKQGVLGFLKGKLSSAKRFFKGNLTDAVKQQCYCIILGEHYETQENLGFQEDMQRELKQREEEFIKKSNIKIFACTWNLNAYLPEKTTHYLNNIFIHNQKYELVVMAFQELVELKPQNLMMSTHQKHNSQNYWQQIILHNLGKDYFLVNSANLVGIQTLIFARNELNGRISEIEIDTVKCGFAGQLGNKGGVAVRLNIDDTSIAFLNCHLPAGQSKVNDRLSALQQCMQLSYQQEGMAAYKKDPLNKSDKFVLLGDLNFRVDRKYADCLSAINKYKDLKKDFKLHEAQALLEEQILNFDQLTCIRKLQDRPRSSSNISAIDTQMNVIPKSMSNLSVPENSNAMEKSQIIKTLYEKRIHFLPTYKFDSGTDTYDTSKKQRVPSFCDRIMIWDIENDNAQIEDQILLYESCNLDNSDHKPVCAVIQFQVKFIDKDLREQVIEEIINVQTHQSKDLESLRSTNNPPNQSEINIDFIFTKNENQNQNAQEMQNVQYIQKHQKNDLIQFTTQNSSTTFNTNTNTQNTQNTRTLYPASQFGNKGGNNQVGTIYTNKTTSYKNLNPTNQTQMSNNYDGNTVWNFDFNQFNTIKEEDSNVANTPHLVQNNQQEDLLDDHFFDNLGNPNIQDELKNIILKEEQSLPHQGQQFQFGNKQVSTDHWDQQSQVPNLLSLDSDKPNQPYSTNYSHHKRNSLTNHQLNEAPSPQPQQNQQQQINLQLNGQNQQGNQQSWYYQQNQQQQYQQAQQFQQNQYQQNNQFGHVQNNQMNYNQFNQNQQQQQQQNGGGGATGYSSFNYSNNQPFNR